MATHSNRRVCKALKEARASGTTFRLSPKPLRCSSAGAPDCPPQHHVTPSHHCSPRQHHCLFRAVFNFAAKYVMSIVCSSSQVGEGQLTTTAAACLLRTALFVRISIGTALASHIVHAFKQACLPTSIAAPGHVLTARQLPKNKTRSCNAPCSYHASVHRFAANHFTHAQM